MSGDILFHLREPLQQDLLHRWVNFEWYSMTPGQTSSAFKTLDTSQHSTNGMPICRHCGLQLSGWQEFRYRILNSCTAQTAVSATEKAGASRGACFAVCPEPLKQQVMGSQDLLELVRTSCPSWFKLVGQPGMLSLCI